jgi:hypothetical protein
MRLEVIAHLVQHAADGARHDVDRRVRDALDRIRPGTDRSREDLILLGACARALGSVRRYADALCLSAQALEGWHGLGLADDASRVLCEHLRLAGLLDDRAAIEAAIGRHVRPLLADPAASEDSCFFTALATGRTLVTCGKANEALEFLDGGRSWGLAQDHARWARQRWIARAFDALGRAADADRERSVLERDSRAVAKRDTNLYLARVDEALARGGDPAPAVRRALAEAEDGAELLAMIEGQAIDAATARLICDHYRY